MKSSAGDGMAFLTVRDALAVQFDAAGEAERLERAARRRRAANQNFGVCNRNYSNDQTLEMEDGQLRSAPEKIT